MRIAGALSSALALGVALLTGCGGGDGEQARGPEALDLGTLSVQVQSAAGFRTLTLKTPAGSRIAFNVLYGSKIVRLDEQAYRRVAFVSTRHGNDEIYTQNTDGSDLTRLTINAAVDAHPSWAPDGNKLAYHTTRDGNNEIYTMNSNGGGATRLTNNAAVDWRPAWSPRGDKIAFVSDRAGNYEIYRMNTDGSNQERLTNSAGDDLDPAWSPNGRQIYFSSQRDGNREIYVMNADGSGQMNLTNNAADDQEPACSPDGSQVAFRTDRDGNTEIYIMQSDGRNAGNFTNHGASDEHPTWAPDAGQYNIGQMALRSTRHGGTDLFIMDLQYQTMVNMTSTGASESDPAWCPAPKVTRTLIGPLGSDGGSDPPLGTSRPLAIVSVRVDGLMSAATVAISAANEGTLDVEPIDNLGAYLAGVKIIGTDITSVREDMGRGLPARVWVVNNSPETNAVLVFLAGDTGKVSSVVAVTDNPVAPVQVEPTGAVVVLRGEFPAVYAAGDFERNLAEGGTREVRLEARTGEVLAIGGAVRSATGKGGAPS